MIKSHESFPEFWNTSNSSVYIPSLYFKQGEGTEFFQCTAQTINSIRNINKKNQKERHM
jgi:hypothetical protein